MTTLTRYVEERADALRQPRLDEIVRVEVGSTLHGTGLPGHEDEDLMAIVIEPPADALGIHQWETEVRRSQPQGVRSGPADVDLTRYTLRKWATLAAQGNPSILLPLWAPPSHTRYSSQAWDDIVTCRRLFVTRSAGKHFLGYASAQRARLTGERGGKHTNRPELVDVHGYDTKYATHLLRLLGQGIELMAAGELILPIPAERADFLRSVRRGEVPLEAVLALSHVQMDELEERIDACAWPDRADRDRISWLVAGLYLRAWQERPV